MQTPTSTSTSTPASAATEISIPDAIRQLRALDASFSQTTSSQSKLNLTDSSIPDDADAAPRSRSKSAQRLRLAAALAALLPLWAGWTVFCFFYVQSTFTHPWPAPAFAACIALAAALPLLSTLAVCGALRIRVLPSQREPSASQRKASDASQRTAPDADASQRTASDADAAQRRASDANASQRKTSDAVAAQRETKDSDLETARSKDSDSAYSFRKPALVFLLAAALALVPPLAVYGAFLAPA